LINRVEANADRVSASFRYNNKYDG